MTSTILIVDDDPVQRRLLEAMVRRFGYDVRIAESGAEALDTLRGEPEIAVVVLDLVMPELDGMGLLAKMREGGLDTPVIVQTGHGSIETVVQAMRAGALDFVVKPVGAERLQVSLANALRVDQLEDEIRRMKRRANGTLSFKDLASRSPDMLRVIRLAERAAKSNIPVLIEGESGVGKEVLARAIQEGEVDPVGGKRSVRVDIRLISATNKSLLDLVKDGRFREDLYYRLNVFPMTLPPLRGRREDIPDLVRSFVARTAAEEGKRVRAVSPAAMDLLTRYDWPGNVRQLENAIFRAVVLCDGDELSVDEFPQIAAQMEGYDVRIPPAPVFAETGTAQAPIREIVRVEVKDPNAVSILDEEGQARTLDELEAEIIRFALKHYRGHMSEVSRRLGIGRSTLYRKLKEFGLEDEAAA